MFGWLATPMFPHLRGVKVIQCLLAGVDWILPWLPKGILLCDGQGLHNIPVAEWIVGAILASLWRLPHYRDCQDEQYWDGQVLLKGAGGTQAAPADSKAGPHSYRILADELHGKKVLIVGYGGIGSEVERLLKGFDVEVVRVARTAKPGVSAFGDLAGLLPEADVVVLLVPLTDATRGMMNADMLARIEAGGVADQRGERAGCGYGRTAAATASQAHPCGAGCDGPGAAAQGTCALERAELFHHAAHCGISRRIFEPRI